jgi:hypothetical protein
MDYDTINLGEPAQMVGKTSTYSKGGSGSGIIASRIGGGCIEDACCPKDTEYNKKFAICIPKMAPFNVTGITSTNGANFKYFIADKSWKNESICGIPGYSSLDLSCNSATAPKQPFTTISGSRSLSLSDQAKPNDAYEFSEYNLYK